MPKISGEKWTMRYNRAQFHLPETYASLGEGWRNAAGNCCYEDDDPYWVNPGHAEPPPTEPEFMAELNKPIKS